MTTFIGAASNTLVVTIQGLVLIPIYLEVLGPTLYGAWLATGEILVWMQAFDLGIPNLLIQRIGSAAADNDDRTSGRYFASGLLVLLLLSILLLAVAFQIADAIPVWFNVHGEAAVQLSECFELAAAATALLIVNNACVGLARAFQDATISNITLVVSTLAGFVVSGLGLFLGWGLWAVPAGMFARTIGSFIGSAVFLRAKTKRVFWSEFRITKHVLLDVLRTCPATAVGGIGYATMNQTDSTIVGLMLGPQFVPVLVLTRKCIDVARAVLDSISYSSFAGFSHLIGSADRIRAVEVHREISSVRISLGFATAAIFISVNQGLVLLWVGEERFGGIILTVLLGIHSICLGSSYLFNSLYKATGAIVRGSVLLLSESILRLPLALVLLNLMGLSGLPMAGSLTAIASMVLTLRLTRNVIGSASQIQSLRSDRVLWIARLGLLAGAILFDRFAHINGWPQLALAAFVCSSVILTVLTIADPRLQSALRHSWSLVLNLRRLNVATA